LSHRAAVVVALYSGMQNPLGLDICGGADHLGTCVIEFYTEHIAFSRIHLPYVGIIMVCMHVSLVELPFYIVMRRIPALDCMLSGARGFL
jgi:hypothetical protein